MEDLPEKLRRNVVVLSGIIILTWFLDIEISSHLAIIGHIDNLDKGKLWICTAIIMLYVFLRYRFDKNTIQEWQSTVSEFNSIRYRKLCSLLSSELRKNILFQKRTSCLINPSEYKYQHPEFDKLKIVVIDITAIAERDSQNSYSGQAHFSHSIIWNDGRTSARSGGDGIQYKESTYVRVALSIKSVLQILRYSKSGVDVIYPIIFWYFAFIITVNRFTSDWLMPKLS